MPKLAPENIKFFVNVNGNPLNNLLHLSVTSTNCFSADTFALTFALDAFTESEIAFWSLTPSAYMEINVSADLGVTQQSLITGMVDSIVIDPIYRTVAVEGRDLSASLIDSYRQQDFVNQTASEIVAQIAISHNLIPVVTATSGSVGRYYGDGYTRLSLGQFSRVRSDWDLIVELARENSFDVFVQGRLLFFQPISTGSQYTIGLGLNNVQRLRIERSLIVGSGTTARVQSWDSQKMTSYDSEKLNSNVAPPIDGSGQPFLFSATNFTLSQVADSADRLATELGRLATVLQIEMPWTTTLEPRSSITFSGLDILPGTTFVIDSIERKYSSTAGSTQSLRAISG